MAPKAVTQRQLRHGNELFGHSGKMEMKASVSCHLTATRVALTQKSEGRKCEKGGVKRNPHTVGGIAKTHRTPEEGYSRHKATTLTRSRTPASQHGFRENETRVLKYKTRQAQVSCSTVYNSPNVDTQVFMGEE